MPKLLGMVSQASQKNIDSCHTLAHLVIFALLNNDHSFLIEDALNWLDLSVYLSQCTVKIDAINMINNCTKHGVKTWIRCVCCSKVLATLSKFHTSGGTRQKKHPSLHQPRNKKMTENWHLFAVSSLVTQKKYNSHNCIVFMIINFFVVIMVIGGPAIGVANPKLWWGQMFDFRQATALLFGLPLLKAQNVDMLKFGAHGPLGSSWLRLWVLHCLFSWEVCTHSYFLHNFTHVCLFH